MRCRRHLAGHIPPIRLATATLLLCNLPSAGLLPGSTVPPRTNPVPPLFAGSSSVLNDSTNSSYTRAASSSAFCDGKGLQDADRRRIGPLRDCPQLRTFFRSSSNSLCFCAYCRQYAGHLVQLGKSKAFSKNQICTWNGVFLDLIENPALAPFIVMPLLAKSNPLIVGP